jgi:hypothetical protein
VWKLIDAFLGPASRDVLANRLCIKFLVNYALDRVSAWITVIALIVLTYRLTSSLSYVALVMLVHVLGRALLVFVRTRFSMSGYDLVSLAAIVKVGALTSLIMVNERSDIWWALISVTVYSVAAAISEASVSRMIPDLGPIRFVPSINRIVGRLEQVAAVGGPAIAAVILLLASERAAFALAAVLSYASLILVRRIPRTHGIEDDLVRWDNPFPPVAWRLPVTARVVLVGLVAVAALGMIVRITLVDVVIDSFGYQAGIYALLICIFGLGSLVGPLPVDRLLGHFTAGLVFLVGVAGLTAATIVIGWGASLILIVPALMASGIAIATLDLVAAVSLRMSVPDRKTAVFEETLIRSLLAGHVCGILAVLTLSTVFGTLVTVTIAGSLCLLTVGVHFLRVSSLRSTGVTRQTERAKTSAGP